MFCRPYPLRPLQVVRRKPVAREDQFAKARSNMPAAYEIRAGGDVKNKKQSMADLKLRRLNELNLRLKEDLDRPRVKVAEASMS